MALRYGLSLGFSPQRSQRKRRISLCKVEGSFYSAFMTDTSHLSLLGKASAFPESPEAASLEAFANKTPGREYIITLETHEFSSLCPVTGQPDTAFIRITYVPADFCVETKSLKYYLASYRNYPAFNEVIVNRILDDLVSVMSPAWLRVEGKFGQRGGIQLTTVAEHQKANRPL